MAQNGSAPTPAAEVRLLGPLELTVGGRAIDVGGPRQRVVLAVLALNVNRVVSVEQLVDAVWDDEPPSTARGQIQIAVSALRKLLDRAGRPDVIRTRAPGYLLNLPPAAIDVVAFDALLGTAQELAADGRLDETAATLRRALTLWRGPAMADLVGGVARRAALPLDERRLSAREELLRAELALGRHRELVGELQALVDEHPLQETPYVLLMLALYRSGRQAEALAVARQARTRLIEEVGTDPGSELRELEREILNQDPALELPHPGPPATPHPGPAAAPRPGPPAAGAEPVVPPRSTPTLLPASIADFTGRTDEIERIRRLLCSERVPHAVPVVAVSGEGGVGKSALAVRAAYELAAEFPDGILYADLTAAESDGGVIGVLGRFLRALGLPGPTAQDELPYLVDIYRSRLAGLRVLVVLDDVQNEEHALPLVPGSPRCAVITTSRVRLSGLPGAAQVALRRFGVDRSVELLARMVGADRVRSEADCAADLVRLCGGLPLALRIAGARLAARPDMRIRRLVHRLLDETHRLDELSHRGLALRSTIELTYRALDGRAQELFRLVGLVRCGEFTDWTAAALLDSSLAEAEDVLARLIDAQVVDTVCYAGEPAPRYRMHELVALYSAERLSLADGAPDCRAALARLAGGHLTLAEAVLRTEYGGDFLVVHATAPRWRPVDADPDRLPCSDPHWWDRERRGVLAAVRQTATAGLHELSWDLALTTFTLFQSRGCLDDWQEVVQLAAAATARAQDERGQAAMLCAEGDIHVARQRLADADRCFAAATVKFEAAGDAHGRALVLYNRALVDRLRGDPTTALRRGCASLEVMRRVGDRAGEALLLVELAKQRLDEGRAELAEPLLAEAAAICRDNPCTRVETRVAYRLGELYVLTNRDEAARRLLDRTLSTVRAQDDRIGEAHVLYVTGMLQHRAGQLERAADTLRQAGDLAGQVCEHLLGGQILQAAAEVALAAGDVAAARPQLPAAPPVVAELDPPLWHRPAQVLRTEIEAHAGEVAAAAHTADRASAVLSGGDPDASRPLRGRLAASRLAASHLVDA